MDNSYNVIVDTNEINLRKMKAIEKYNELYKMIKECQKMFEETVEYYDVPSSKEFRVVAYRYLDIALLYLENNIKPYFDKLDVVLNSYNDFYTITGSTIESGDNNEV